MSLDKKILSEINRYRSINKYIMEQDAEAPLDLGALAPEAGATPPPPPADVAATPPPPPTSTHTASITGLVNILTVPPSLKI